MSDWIDDPLYDQRQEAESWRQAAEDELDDWDDRPDWWFDDDENRDAKEEAYNAYLMREGGL